MRGRWCLLLLRPSPAAAGSPRLPGRRAPRGWRGSGTGSPAAAGPRRSRKKEREEDGRKKEKGGEEDVRQIGQQQGWEIPAQLLASRPPPHRRVYSGEYEFGCDIPNYHSSVYAREILVGILRDASRSLNNCLATSSFSFPLIMIKENALINNYNCLSKALIKDTRLLAVMPPYAAAPICQICIYIQSSIYYIRHILCVMKSTSCIVIFSNRGTD
jgi:hypothetical protein